MANITKQGDSYLIRVSCGYDINNKQLRKSMTWTPEPGMTANQIKKELNRQATLFEEKCLSGQFLDGSIKFADFAEIWMEKYAVPQLRAKTVARYKDLLIRIDQAIGHIRLDKLQPQHLLSFYENLGEASARKDTKYTPTKDFKAFMKSKGWNRASLSREANLSVVALDSAIKNQNVSASTMDKICKTMGIESSDIFAPVKKQVGLSDKSILHHHRLISSILSTAVEWQILLSNPCQRIKAPKVQHKEAKYLDEEAAQHLLQLIDEEAPLKYRCAIYLDIGTGLRRGELCGLEWSDFDFKNETLDIQRSSLYLPEKGVYADDTKNSSSRRSMKLSPSLITLLKTYKAWQNNERLALGDKWVNSNRIFTSWDGHPIHPDTLTSWFSDFASKHGFQGITLHSLRHTNASLQIARGIPIRTVSSRLGHAQTSTTTNIYAHAIRSADAAAADALDDIFKSKITK